MFEHEGYLVRIVQHPEVLKRVARIMFDIQRDTLKDCDGAAEEASQSSRAEHLVDRIKETWPGTAIDPIHCYAGPNAAAAVSPERTAPSTHACSVQSPARTRGGRRS